MDGAAAEVWNLLIIHLMADPEIMLIILLHLLPLITLHGLPEEEAAAEQVARVAREVAEQVERSF